MKTKYVPIIVAIVGAVLLSVWCREARAQNEGVVAVGGEWILTVRVPAGGMSVKERADRITERLVTILSDPSIKPQDITAVPLGRTEAKIMVKKELLVTVDSETARVNQMDAMALAKKWVSHLRRVIPQVNVKPNPMLGEPVRR